ncbi:putative zinc-binding peptidase [soil metagenome]
MKLFKCQSCGQLLYFENTRCERCSHKLAFDSSRAELLTLIQTANDTFSEFNNSNNLYRYCANSQHNVCNWLIPFASSDQYCVACKLNEIIPDIRQPDRFAQWKKLESAKHRLIYTLLKLKLPLLAKTDDTNTGMAFNFLAEEEAHTKVIMGHADGLITINLAEADDTKRVAMREKLQEPYRTLTGHFRHESGHYYWDRLVRDSTNLQSFRSLFGDESIDYGDALKHYYRVGPPANWNISYVSAYSTAHPWEDWAETWAHYLHIIDTLETAYSHGLQICPVGDDEGRLVSNHQSDPYTVENFSEIIKLWYPLTVTVNSLNHSMGKGDFYPFVIPPNVVQKLDFIHRLCRKSVGNVQHVIELSFYQG